MPWRQDVILQLEAGDCLRWSWRMVEKMQNVLDARVEIRITSEAFCSLRPKLRTEADIIHE
jgi:hypothetical protein